MSSWMTWFGNKWWPTISWRKTGLMFLLQPWGPWGLKVGWEGTNKIWWLGFHLTNKGGCSSVRWQMERRNVEEKLGLVVLYLVLLPFPMDISLRRWSFVLLIFQLRWMVWWLRRWLHRLVLDFQFKLDLRLQLQVKIVSLCSECFLEWSCSKWSQWDCGTSTWGAKAVCWWSCRSSNCWAASQLLKIVWWQVMVLWAIKTWLNLKLWELRLFLTSKLEFVKKLSDDVINKLQVALAPSIVLWVGMVGGGSALPSQAGLSPLLPPGLGQGQHGLLSQQVGHAGPPQPGGHLPQGGQALHGGHLPQGGQAQHGGHLPQGGQGLSGGQVPRAPQQPQAQPPHFGETLNESLRSLELPKIPQDCSALEFGDWLAVVGPLMADLSGSSGQWWALVLTAANEAYARWQVSTPLERLRLRVVFPLDIYRWPRTEQRAATMLLAAVPDGIRREMIASRKLNSMDILFTLLRRFQPGGASERASLLRDISDPQLKQNANVQDFLTALRQWRRNLHGSGRWTWPCESADEMGWSSWTSWWCSAELSCGVSQAAAAAWHNAELYQCCRVCWSPSSRSWAACFVRAEHYIDLDDDLGFELFGVCGENQEGASEGCRSSSWGGLSKKGWHNHQGQVSLLGNSCWMQTCWWV